MYDVNMTGESPTWSEVERQIKANCVAFRKVSGLTQQQVAELADMSVASVARYESFGKAGQCPDREAMEKLAGAYGRSVGDFYLANPPTPRRPVGAAVSFKILSKDLDDDLRKKVEAAEASIRAINTEHMRRVTERLHSDIAKRPSKKK